MVGIDSLIEWPVLVGEKLGLTPFAAGMLLTVIALVIVCLPTMMLTRGKVWFLDLAVGLGVLGFCTAIGWSPVFFMVVLVLAIVGLWGWQFLQR